MASTAKTYNIRNISSTKAAEIYREENGRIYYVCFHCGFDSDNVADMLVHIKNHFSTQNINRNNDLVDVKYELIEDNDQNVVDPTQLEQIFHDCGTKPILNNEQCFQMDTFSDADLSDEQTLSVTEKNTDMDGLFEWKCLHCHCLFKRRTKLKIHLKKHNSNDPVLINGTTSNGNVVMIKAHYSFKCTLCLADFYDSISADKHLKDFHAAVPPPIKCETFSSTESLKERMSTVQRNKEKETKIKVLPTETRNRKVVPSEAKTTKSVCIFCDKTIFGTLELMQHTFGHFNLKIFSCPKCPTELQRLTSLNAHMNKKHHLKAENKFLCKFCDDSVDHLNLFEFVTHAFTHHLDDGDQNASNLDTFYNYGCRFCFVNFEKWDDARAHMKSHAEDELPKEIPSAANTSDRRFTERATSGTHRSEFLYNCCKCSSTLCGSYEARKHKIVKHGIFEHLTEKRWVIEQKQAPIPVTYRILTSQENEEKESFKCYDCDCTFNTIIHLMRHRLMHFNVQPYSCTLCPQSFSSRGNLTRHSSKVHELKEDLERQLACKYCKMEFIEDSKFIEHNFKDHLYDNFDIRENLDGLCQYECLYCNDMIMERDLMDQHLTTHIGEVIPRVKQVTQEDTGSDEFSINELSHNIEFMYVCLHCQKQFRLPFMASEHTKLAHKETLKRGSHCNLCDIKFKTWRSLVNHQAKVHPETMKPTKISPESKCRARETNRNWKKKNRKTPEGNVCYVCNLTFINNRSMINHKSKRHPETVQKREFPKYNVIYNCTTCGKTFRDRSNFHHHVETHLKRHSFTCDICNKTYRLKNSLQTHMLIHTKEKNFVCEECGKSFYTTSKLNLHKQVHENLTLQCDKCEKVFYTRNNFSKHSKTHIDKERKKCQVCDNTFKSSVSLRVHMSLHEGTKKYACRYCDMTFAQSSGRRGHEKSRHGFV